MTVDIKIILDDLNRLSDDDIIEALRRNNLFVTDDKYHNAFSCYGAIARITLPEDPNIPPPVREGIMRAAVYTRVAQTISRLGCVSNKRESKYLEIINHNSGFYYTLLSFGPGQQVVRASHGCSS